MKKMQVKILGWSYKGIRGVNNLDVSLETSQNSPYQTSLIMMPNGTGKTTTITLMRAIFDGTATGWKMKEIKEFRPNSSVSEGLFTARILLDHSPYHITIKLDYVRGAASYMTSRTGTQGGLNIGHDLPTYIKDVFSPEFVKRFVFDGELANSILSSEKGEAEEAIRFLYHINRLSDVKNSIDRIVTEEQRKNEKSKTRTEQGLNYIRNQISAKKAQRSILLKRIGLLDDEKSDLSIKIKGIGSLLSSARKKDTGLEKMIKEQEKKQIENTLKLKEATSKFLDEFRNPNLINPQIAERLASLSGKMQHLKLPSTMSRQFFEELADKDACVCGRSIGNHEKQYIIDNAKEYLAEDQIGVINSIKSSVKNRFYSETATAIKDGVQELLHLKYRLAGDLERLLQQRREDADEDEQKLLDEQSQLQQQYNMVNNELELLTTKERVKLLMVSEDNNLYLVEESLTELENKYKEATKTVQLAQNAEKIKSYIGYIEAEALKNLKEMIKTETNSKLSKIIKSEPIIVEQIDRHLILQGKTGTSVGQSLAIAYSYLGSLFHSSSHELPFFVDSPAGALDLGVRREVSKILPDLFEQLIIFITSGEREGFAEHFYKINDVQFLTIHKTAAPNAKCEAGIEYFKTFQELTSIGGEE
ncbi:hypothetical protein [Paenibacillus roseipurpureus]|uniref:Rad50/SbcC-type AAA domain-containing protein n=1 Tax=Paenibacillus roseopurpureus TaxID=2918901 RepID=A0AA96LSA4_9BACL|nr:hypothetical protein [Paenibacillus sp. MBLB1832]WNR45129.1 hypothetical protein MJB10_02970 [Paenibacillus sp. MBLB1832]